MKLSFLPLFFLLFSTGLYAQEIKFTESPEDYRLYARDASNTADVLISGSVKNGLELKEFTLKVFKGEVLLKTEKTSLKNKKFSISTEIYAGLHQYKLEFYVRNKTKDSLLFVADNVVCGDAYIITGQSNSHASSSFSTYNNPYCRSFGVKTGYESYNESDKKVRWGLASGNCPDLKKNVGGWFTKNPFGVGVWGMELMKLIVEKYKVPVCIINGGSGSSSIEQNMLYPEKASLETSFGRLAYRVNNAGLKDKIKAVFWHQGESNSVTEKAYKSYASNFDILLEDWKRVYTGLEKVYLFQLHPGCGRQLKTYHSEMREVQNQIAEKYEMVNIMSTMGVPGHDGCHFSYDGYLEFSKRIFPLLSRDFYKEKVGYAITPPTLIKANYISPKEVELIFDQPLVLEEKKKVDGVKYFLKNQFFFSHKLGEKGVSVKVKRLDVDGNTLTILFKDATNYNFITYLPSKNYEGTEVVYNGPWVFGKENSIGALSFYQREIFNSSEQIDKNTTFHGYKMIDSTLNGVNYKIVFPEKANKNKDWIWRARFWGHEPQTDITLLEQGFHIAYINVSGRFGSDKAVNIWDNFYDWVTKKYNLNSKVALEGMSRGGLIVFNWGNRNAEKLSCIYVDAPVCDFTSWPGGKGSGEGSLKAWNTCMNEYGFSEEVALEYNGNPISHLEKLASYKIPILAVVGDEDKVVPVTENIDLVQNRLKKLGWDLEIIHKPGVGHHPHSLKEPKQIVDFILKNSGNLKE